MERKRVYIAYTGGTIGMKGVDGVYLPISGYLSERMVAMPELQRAELPEYTLHEYAPLLDSANMTPADWERIGRDIIEHHDAYDGFVIIHGTDTMAYTASALSFMLGGLQKPVILTGSQIPLAEVRSDARENLITSMLLAADYPIPEVCLYLSGKLLRGNRSRKVSASGFDAFDSPNFPPLGRVGVDIHIDERLVLPFPTAPLRLQPLREVVIGTLRLFPGVSAALLRNVLQEPVEGFILETYGAGNAPVANERLVAVLAEATSRGVIIVNCTQCLRGGVDMSGYATGHALREAGVTSGADMTPEAALGKLMVLLSRERTPEEVRKEMLENLRGELTLA